MTASTAANGGCQRRGGQRTVHGVHTTPQGQWPGYNAPRPKRRVWVWVFLSVLMAVVLAIFVFLVSIVIHMGPPAPS
ncbi:hypothetical protein J5X84_06120 [Streptosporangiaceae bacterium NEAU-GS5]|nr:hypothetical protein [Streptosporangiaceae bacterium NEAU-GS5]